MESLDYEGRTKPWYRKKSVWLIMGPLFISFAFTLAVSAPPAGAWQQQRGGSRRSSSCGCCCCWQVVASGSARQCLSQPSTG
jgi:hypothetical protein